ncbi:MAG TPA: rod shape-determining protein MreC, partial [Kofleriaceae bacterium]|nr:rod shape-determining protein MreC [Kofleriaceae bacterium]
NLHRNTTSTVDKALLRITAPLQAGVSWVVEGIGGLWGRYVALVDVEDENRELRDENERLRRELSTMTRRAYDVQALEDLAVVKRSTPADTLGARVIGAPMSPQFRVLRLRIDRGEKDIQVGMPVITGTGPVGRINKVFGDYADVTLISDPSSSVEVVIPRTGGRGILRGLGRSDSYTCAIEWLERGKPLATNADSRVQVGDDVVTSGLGASFPPGLVIGKVSVVGKDDGMFQKVEVAPAVDVSRVRAVEVLLAPPPPPDPDAKTKRKSEPAYGGRPL